MHVLWHLDVATLLLATLVVGPNLVQLVRRLLQMIAQVERVTTQKVRESSFALQPEEGGRFQCR